MSNELRHTFVISDHHFGSWRLPRPFVVLSQSKENEFIEKWNLTIGKNDYVYYNGDFADCNVKELCDYAKCLNGKIILVKGNHDTLPNELYKAVFYDVVDEVDLDDLGIVIHHCPDMQCTKTQLFGHFHRGQSFERINGICTCASVNDGWPLSLEKALMLR